MKDDIIELLSLVEDFANEIECEFSDAANALKGLAEKFTTFAKQIEDLRDRVENSEDDESEEEEGEEDEKTEEAAA